MNGLSHVLCISRAAPSGCFAVGETACFQRYISHKLKGLIRTIVSIENPNIISATGCDANESSIIRSLAPGRVPL